MPERVLTPRFLLLASMLAGCAPLAEAPKVLPVMTGPAWKFVRQHYDGVADDLLTGGLGASGLAKPQAPGFKDARNPTAAELRTRAIHTNYRALVDMTPGGGYGSLWGPTVGLHGKALPNDGKIAGEEFLAYSNDGSNTTLMVQVPASFDAKNACILAAPSSGSRGVYGAIATVGEWALKRGCAVAYTDKGTGTGAHDLSADTVNRMSGERRRAAEAGASANFRADLDAQQVARFNAQYPNRFAFKHAHSQRNPEKDWGRWTLESIEFALLVLNQRPAARAAKYTAENTLIIAANISNGGYASLRAAELDTGKLIDAVVVEEPNVSLAYRSDLAIRQGKGPAATAHSRPLLDYATLVNLYQPCASTAVAAGQAPFNSVPLALGAARCESLGAQGLLKSKTLAEQGAEAQKVLNDAGIPREANLVHPSHYTFNVPQAIAVTYANAYGRFSVADNLCGYSFAATVPATKDGNPAEVGKPLPAAGVAAIFAASSGIPPTAGINLVNNLNPGGAKEDRVSLSPASGKADMNLEGALCLRALATGVDPASGQPLAGAMRDRSERVRQGIAETRMSANLRGLPTLIVNGRADAILTPNHASRAYVGVNRLVEGLASRVSYIEVTNAHHVDGFNAFAGFDTRMVPLHYYYLQALGAMWAHLKEGKPLPPSQVVHTTPRGGADGKAPPIAAANLPPIAGSPAADSRIVFEGGVLAIPE